MNVMLEQLVSDNIAITAFLKKHQHVSKVPAVLLIRALQWVNHRYQQWSASPFGAPPKYPDLLKSAVEIMKELQADFKKRAEATKPSSLKQNDLDLMKYRDRLVETLVSVLFLIEMSR